MNRVMPYFATWESYGVWVFALTLVGVAFASPSRAKARRGFEAWLDATERLRIRYDRHLFN